MTKKELLEKAQTFIDNQDDTSSEEWYATDKCLKADVLNEFLKSIGIEEQVK